jgi:hypothetical protein
MRLAWIGALVLVVMGVGVAAAQEPRGTVPPPPAAAPEPAPAARDTGVLTPPPAPEFQAEVAAVVGRFDPAYALKGSPRIAVYWNRQLSDRLSQWNSTDRVVLEERAAVSGQRTGPAAERVDVQAQGERDAALTRQGMGQEARRAGPGEPWEWEFQNGFLDPFMRARARIVDRAAIMRITAAGTQTRVGRPRTLDAAPVEVDALRGLADLFVEVLLTPSPQMPGGQEFLAVVKDVNTGQILAHVNSRNAMQRLSPRRDYVATSRGFEPRDTPPPLRDLASNLAINVMDALLQAWRR